MNELLELFTHLIREGELNVCIGKCIGLAMMSYGLFLILYGTRELYKYGPIN